MTHPPKPPPPDPVGPTGPGRRTRGARRRRRTHLMHWMSVGTLAAGLVLLAAFGAGVLGLGAGFTP